MSAVARQNMLSCSTLCCTLQAMSLISVAQQSGDVSAELYSKYAAQGCISMPRMDGVEDLVVKMQMKEGAAGNPFNSGSAERPPTLPDRGGMAPLGVPGISPPSSQVSFLYRIFFCPEEDSLRPLWLP